MATEVDVDKDYLLAKLLPENCPMRLSLFTFKVVESRIRGIVKSHFPMAKDCSYFRGESMS